MGATARPSTAALAQDANSLRSSCQTRHNQLSGRKAERRPALAPPLRAAATVRGTGAAATVELGRSGLFVPRICFGTMLFGEGTTDYAAAERLMAACLERRVNFFDSAEMYPVPQRAETSGRSEEFLGRWARAVGRERVLIATKVAGPSCAMPWLRGGPPALDAAAIKTALDASLLRLGTDYVDLYQLHWPDRYVPMFGDADYDARLAYAAASPLEEQLEALGAAVAAGKARAVGLSNETPWGLMTCLKLAERHPDSLPRVASIQNAYSLTCRGFDAGLAECCDAEGVALLAYSPLAMGLLTGKYEAPGGGPPGARLNRYKGRYAEAESRYGMRPAVRAAVREYVQLAEGAGLTPAQMAIRFVLGRPLVAAAVIGATSPEQLEEQLDAADAGPLDEALLQAIDEVHARLPNPTP